MSDPKQAVPELVDSAAALRDGVERALGEFLTVDYWHELESAKREAELDPALWQLISELAIPTLLLDESHGGADASLLEAAGALEALGALAVPAPAAESLVASWCAGKAGLTLPVGMATLGPAMPTDPVLLTRREGGIHLQANLRQVPFARHCDVMVLQGQLDSTCVTMAVHLTGPGVAMEPAIGLSGEARDNVQINTTVATTQCAEGSGPDLLQAGAAMRAVQMASAVNAGLNMCVAYVSERTQFGRPLAKFQAIQQQLAVMTALATNAKVGARQAFATLGDARSHTAAPAAKTAAGQAASQGAAIAHQVHGAMGFTAEYGLHRLTRRLWTWREEFGNEAWWGRHLGEMALSAGADGLWDLLVNEPA